MGKVFGDVEELVETANGAAAEAEAVNAASEPVTEQPKKYRHRMIIEARPYVKGEDVEDVSGFDPDEANPEGFIAWPLVDPDNKGFIDNESFAEYFEEVKD